jgi:hypothetical protein
MNVSLVVTEELRKTNQLVQAWNDLASSLDNPMSTEQLLNELPPDIQRHCAWGTVSAAQRSANVENLGGKIETCLTSSGKNNGENRKSAGIVVGMMSELGNGLRFDRKPTYDDGAFRAQDGRPIKYRVTSVPTSVQGDAHCGWLAVGDWAFDAT